MGLGRFYFSETIFELLWKMRASWLWGSCMVTMFWWLKLCFGINYVRCLDPWKFKWVLLYLLLDKDNHVSNWCTVGHVIVGFYTLCKLRNWLKKKKLYEFWVANYGMWYIWDELDNGYVFDALIWLVWLFEEWFGLGWSHKFFFPLIVVLLFYIGSDKHLLHKLPKFIKIIHMYSNILLRTWILPM